MMDYALKSFCQCDGLITAVREKEKELDEAKESLDHWIREWEKFETKQRAAYEAIDQVVTIFPGKLAVLAAKSLRETIASWYMTVKRLEGELKDLKSQRNGCASHLERCAECGGLFTTTIQGCIRKCAGCGKFYCINCFDVGIELWEIENPIPMY